MARETALEYFIGTDHSFEFTILNADEDEAVNIGGWTLSFMIKKSLAHADSAAKVTKTTTGGGVTIAGTYNSDRAVNTQKATATVQDTDTDALAAGDYFYELKRMDGGGEAVLAYGGFTMLRTVHRS